MVTCPKCGCGDCKKDGIVNGRQRHKSKQPPAKAGGLKSSAESTDTGQRPVIIQF